MKENNKSGAMNQNISEIRFTQNFTLTRCSMLTLNMIPMENKNVIHFKQRLLLNCWLHDLEIVTVNGEESPIQYHTLLVVAKFAGKQKKIKSCYLIITPRIPVLHHALKCQNPL